MSRLQKILICVGLALMSAIVVAVVVAEMAAPIASKGIGSAPPVTASGWIQLALAVMSAAGFSGATIWQAALAWLESRGAAVIQRVAPGVSPATAKAAVDVAKITGLLTLIKSTKDPAAQAKYIEAARLDFDALRDELFPLPAAVTQ